MENPRTPPWVPDAEALECHFCKVQFGLLTRRHHCRACGNVFCHQCCYQRLRLPDFGIQELVRVCLSCFRTHTLEDIWEAESFTVRYYLRLHTAYSLHSSLFESSRRNAREKSMFVVLDAQKQEYILSLLSSGPHCPVPYQSSESARLAFRRALLGLRHPFIWPITEADFVGERGRAVVLQPLAPQGSVRDVMHRVNPKAVFGEKYKKEKVAPLPTAQIALYGRQILEALQYALSRNFPVSHLHAGNVLVDKKCCFISGLENDLLGLSYECEPGKETNQSESGPVRAFGRLLFEMATGRRLMANEAPTVRHVSASAPPFHKILHSIFMAPVGPTVEELLRLTPFADVALVADVGFIHQLAVDPTCQRLLERVKARSTSAATREEEEQKMSGDGSHGFEPRNASRDSNRRRERRKRMTGRQKKSEAVPENCHLLDFGETRESSLPATANGACKDENTSMYTSPSSDFECQATKGGDFRTPPPPPPPPPVEFKCSNKSNNSDESRNVDNGSGGLDALLASIRDPSKRRLKKTGAANWV